MRSLDMRSHANHNHVLNHVPTRVTLWEIAKGRAKYATREGAPLET